MNWIKCDSEIKPNEGEIVLIWTPSWALKFHNARWLEGKWRLDHQFSYPNDGDIITHWARIEGPKDAI